MVNIEYWTALPFPVVDVLLWVSLSVDRSAHPLEAFLRGAIGPTMEQQCLAYNMNTAEIVIYAT